MVFAQTISILNHVCCGSVQSNNDLTFGDGSSLEQLLYEDINQIDAEMVIQTDEMDGSTRMDAGFMMEDTQINELLLNVVNDT